VLSVFPIIDVKDWHAFAEKIIAVLAVTNLIGWVIYKTAERRSRSK
jgi:hypothetical protein